MAFIEQRGIDRRRRHVGKPLAVEHAEQTLLLGDGEGQGGRGAHRDGMSREHATTPSAIAVHEPGVEREGPAGRLHPDVRGKFVDGEHHSFSLVSSAVGRPSATHSFFWASMMSSARSSLRRRRALSRFKCLICRAAASGFGPRSLRGQSRAVRRPQLLAPTREHRGINAFATQERAELTALLAAIGLGQKHPLLACRELPTRRDLDHLGVWALTLR